MKIKINKNQKHRIKIIILLIILIGLGLFIFKHQAKKHGLRICPDEMIVNEMPGIDRSGQTVDDKTPVRSSYYILKGERREIDEFDIVYIGENCRVPVTSAY